MWSLHTADDSGTYGWIDGVVRVDVVVTGTVVEAWRAVTVGLSRAMVVDAVGAAAVRAARPATSEVGTMSFIVMLV